METNSFDKTTNGPADDTTNPTSSGCFTKAVNHVHTSACYVNRNSAGLIHTVALERSVKYRNVPIKVKIQNGDVSFVDKNLEGISYIIQLALNDIAAVNGSGCGKIAKNPDLEGKISVALDRLSFEWLDSRGIVFRAEDATAIGITAPEIDIYSDYICSMKDIHEILQIADNTQYAYPESFFKNDRPTIASDLDSNGVATFYVGYYANHSKYREGGDSILNCAYKKSMLAGVSNDGCASTAINNPVLAGYGIGCGKLRGQVVEGSSFTTN